MMKGSLVCLIVCLVVLCSAAPVHLQTANSKANMEYLRRFMSSQNQIHGAGMKPPGVVYPQYVPQPRGRFNPFLRAAVMANVLDEDIPFLPFFD